MRSVLRRARAFSFLGMAAWLLLSPAYVQVFGGKENSVRAWRMYHRRGVGICAAIYYDHDRRIDRYALFGLKRASAPDEFRRIVDEDEARAMGRQICAKLAEAHARDLDVRVTLRCGVPEGLQTRLDREDNLCDGAASQARTARDQPQAHTARDPRQARTARDPRQARTARDQPQARAAKLPRPASPLNDAPHG
jgi:hypothetical protein